jgi:hypothetical protein
MTTTEGGSEVQQVIPDEDAEKSPQIATRSTAGSGILTCFPVVWIVSTPLQCPEFHGTGHPPRTMPRPPMPQKSGRTNSDFRKNLRL